MGYVSNIQLSYPPNQRRRRAIPVDRNVVRVLRRNRPTSVKRALAVPGAARQLEKLSAGIGLDAYYLEIWAAVLLRSLRTLALKEIVMAQADTRVHSAMKRYIRHFNSKKLWDRDSPSVDLFGFLRMSNDDVFSGLTSAEIHELLELLFTRNYVEELPDGRFVPVNRDTFTDRYVQTRILKQASTFALCVEVNFDEKHRHIEQPRILSDMERLVDQCDQLLGSGTHELSADKLFDRLFLIYPIIAEVRIAAGGADGSLREDLARDLAPCLGLATDSLDLTKQLAGRNKQLLRTQFRRLADDVRELVDDLRAWTRLAKEGASAKELIKAGTRFTDRLLQMAAAVTRKRAALLKNIGD